MHSFATALFFSSLAVNAVFGAAVPNYIARHRALKARHPTADNLNLVVGGVKKGSYIVKLAQGANRTSHLDWANGLVAASTVSTATTVRACDEALWNGYSADLDDSALAQVLARPDVDWVEEDGIKHTTATQRNATWGLQRLSSATPLPAGSQANSLRFTYNFADNAGEGVDVYVVDTGVRTTHEEFEGRATMFNLPDLADTDDVGHGSHVSGTVAGKTFGVAKKATIIGVKVLGSDGSGSNSDIIAGINFAVSSAKQSGRPSIISMSLGGSGSRALDAVTSSAVQNGVHVVVAAGNESQDAAGDSPARALGTITVGAMTIDDQVADFSNFGRVVDIFAPGQGIISCGIKSDDDIQSLDGTSMATPHISGLVAVLLSQDPTTTPAEMVQKVKAIAIQGVLSSIPDRTTPNLLAQVDTTAPAATTNFN